jgi:hypothetical protein
MPPPLNHHSADLPSAVEALTNGLLTLDNDHLIIRWS